MKRSLLLAASLCSIGFAVEKSQQNALVTSPLAVLGGVYNIQYERQLSPQNSMIVRGIFMQLNDASSKGSVNEVDLGYRRYLSSGKTFSGWYWTNAIGYASAKIESKLYAKSSATASGIGFYSVAGYRWITDFGLVSELGGGVGYVNIKAKSDDGLLTLNRAQVGPQIDLNFGYAF